MLMQWYDCERDVTWNVPCATNRVLDCGMQHDSGRVSAGILATLECARRQRGL